jgi:hypothetical protein
LVVAPKKKGIIGSFEVRLEAFNVYEHVVVSADPTRFQEFSNYRQIVQRAQKQYVWSAVAAFDTYHRSLVAANRATTRLHNIDAALYAQILNAAAVKQGSTCYNCKGPDHFSKACPFATEGRQRSDAPGSARTPSDPPFRGKGRSWSEGGLAGYRDREVEICNNFNLSACYYRACRRAHICKICRGEHPASKCRTHTGRK